MTLVQRQKLNTISETVFMYDSLQRNNQFVIYYFLSIRLSVKPIRMSFDTTVSVFWGYTLQGAIADPNASFEFILF